MSEIVLDDYSLYPGLLYTHSTYLPFHYSRGPDLDGASEYAAPDCYDLHTVQLFVAALGIAVTFAGVLYRHHVDRKDSSKVSLWPRRLSLALILLSAATTALQFAFSPIQDTCSLTKSVSWLVSAVLEATLVLMLVDSGRANRPLWLRAGSVIYWLVLTAITAIRLRLYIRDSVIPANSLHTVIHFSSIVCSSLMILIESGSFPTTVQSTHPLEQAGLFSLFSFSWLSSFISLGDRTFLSLSDLYDLRSGDQSAVSEALLRERLDDTSAGGLSISLLSALLHAFGGPYAVAGAYKLCADVSTLAQPMLLRELLLFLSSYTSSTEKSLDRGLVIAAGLFVISVTQVVCKHQYTARSKLVGMRVMSSLSLRIYSRAMSFDTETKELYPVGNIINLVSVDLRRLSDSFAEGHMLWSAPLQTLVGMFLIYQVAGKSLFAGVPVIILTAFAMFGTATLEKRYQARQMKAKDSRLSLIATIIANIKDIKFYNWSNTFLEKAQGIRRQELGLLARVGIMSATNQTVLALAPLMISCSVFSSLAYIERVRLTSDVLFPILALLNTIQFPLTRLPLVITRMITAGLALRRVEAVLLGQIHTLDRPVLHLKEPEPGLAIQLTDACLSWTISSKRLDLQIDNLSLAKGQMLCVLGRIASGKSSLLNSLQGNLHLVGGKLQVKGRSVYVPQTPWILASTIRDNILFGEEWDEERYNHTLRACSLIKDLSMLPRGDLTFVGNGAVSLSGGQKMRVNLARAVYARADLYLIDDCLAAVDSHVAQVLIHGLFSRSGLLRNSTTVLVTNHQGVLPYADKIVMLEGGQVAGCGTFDELFQPNATALSKDQATCNNFAKRELEDVLDSLDSYSEHSTAVTAESTTATEVSTLLQDHTREPCRTEKNTSVRCVDWKVYRDYFRAASFPAWVLSVFLIMIGQASYVGTTVWLKKWSSHNDNGQNPDHDAMYLGVYMGIGAFCAIVLMVSTTIMTAFCCIRASRGAHQNMIASILAAPMQFFHSTPTGKILNRFSSDLRRIDEVLPETLSSLLKFAAKTLFLLTIICIGTPLFVVLIIPLLLVFLSLQRRYLKSARDLTRLQHTTYSSVVSFYQDTIVGALTIRSFDQQDRFFSLSKNVMDDHLKAVFLCTTAESWLGVRLEVIGSFTVLFTVLLSLLSLAIGTVVSQSTCGLVISCALQISTLLNLLVWKSGVLETDMISFEKILEYSNFKNEGFQSVTNKPPPASWPSSGSITFVDYRARYSPNLPLVLDNVNFTLKSGERLGVVGRTGAGKSSLVLALFRMIEAEAGHVSIDGLNTTEISVDALRKCLAIIPQDHFMFEGTVRENLCPGGEYDDTEIWTALDLANLKPLVSAMAGQLDGRILPGGSNISQGFRQLFSLARVFLSPAKILLLDEPTASVDTATDALIQAVLRGPGLAGRTVITIAHRLDTVMDYDRILVMDRGRVVESDTPANLLEQKGLFWRLAYGNLDDTEG